MSKKSKEELKQDSVSQAKDLIEEVYDAVTEWLKSGARGPHYVEIRREKLKNFLALNRENIPSDLLDRIAKEGVEAFEGKTISWLLSEIPVRVPNMEENDAIPSPPGF